MSEDHCSALIFLLCRRAFSPQNGIHLQMAELLKGINVGV